MNNRIRAIRDIIDKLDEETFQLWRAAINRRLERERSDSQDQNPIKVGAFEKTSGNPQPEHVAEDIQKIVAQLRRLLDQLEGLLEKSVVQ